MEINFRHRKMNLRRDMRVLRSMMRQARRSQQPQPVQPPPANPKKKKGCGGCGKRTAVSVAMQYKKLQDEYLRVVAAENEYYRLHPPVQNQTATASGR